MEDLLGVLVLLCAIAAPGRSLSCRSCVAKDSICRGTSVTCPTGSSCGLVYRRTTEDGVTSVDYIKSCVPSKKCNKVGSISYSGGRMKMGISCCTTDNCTLPLPRLPADDANGNGVTCPTCRSTTNSSCDSRSEMQCTGREQKCVSGASVTSESEDSLMGCATQSICDMKDFLYKDDKYKIAVKFICDPGTNSDGTSRDGTLASDKPSLSCFQCTKLDETCKGNMVTCPSGYSCGSTYREMTEGDTTLTLFTKSCMPSKQCKKIGTITHPGGSVRFAISCCDTDFCTPPFPRWPEDDSTEPNGLSCPACSSANSKRCVGDFQIPCVGNQQSCVYQTFMSPVLNYSSAGCGTQSICDLESYSYLEKPFYINMGFGCGAEPESSDIPNKEASPLSCVTCISEESLHCDGELQQCPPDQVCASAYRLFSSDRTPILGVVRSCAPKDKCNAKGTMSVNGLKILMATSCCEEDGCTPPMKLPKNVRGKPNGVKCVACASADSTPCKATATMECNGDEDKCVAYTLLTKSGFQLQALSLRGCGVRSLCDIGSYSYALQNADIENRFTCSSPPQ